MPWPIILGVDVLANLGAKINQAIIAGNLAADHADLLHLRRVISRSLCCILVQYVCPVHIRTEPGKILWPLAFSFTLFCKRSCRKRSFILLSAYDSLALPLDFWMVAAEAVFVYRNRDLFGKQAGSILRNLFHSSWRSTWRWALAPGIDNWGHIGGLLGGLAFA